MNLKHFISIAMGGFLLASCAAEMEEIPAEELYLRDFIKKYGLIDPNQNWSMAHNCVITVKGAAGQNVKIYADIKGTRYIVADYDNVKDPAALTFDLPSGITNVIAKVAGRTYDVAVGGTVNAEAPASRAIYEDDGKNGHLSWKISEPAIMRVAPLKEFMTKFVEDQVNLEAGTNSFYFVADGKEHTFYPFYWKTDAYHCLGIYILENEETNEISMHDLYFSKSGELEFSYDYSPAVYEEAFHENNSQFRLGGTTNAEDPFGLKNADLELIEKCNWKQYLGVENDWNDRGQKYKEFTEENAEFFTDHGYISKISYDIDDEVSWQGKYYFYETVTKGSYTTNNLITPEKGKWENSGNNMTAYNIDQSVIHVRTKGITYKVDAGKKYGFYIKRKRSSYNIAGEGEEPNYDSSIYDYICFSQASRNESYGKGTDTNRQIWEWPWSKGNKWDNELYQEADKFAYASWGTVEWENHNYSLFGFEDWACGDNNLNYGADLNDLMFMFAAGEEPSKVVDEKGPEPTPDPTPDPEPEAYSWTLAVEDLGETDDYDFNDLVLEITRVAGQETATVKALAAGGIMPIKVMYDGKLLAETHVNQWFGEEDHTKMINTTTNDRSHDGGFTISVGAQETMESIMGKFTILVYDDENNELKAKEIRSFETEGVGKTPLMILVENDWEWPKERTDINDAYTGFKAWVSNPEHNWIATKQSGKVIARTK